MKCERARRLINGEYDEALSTADRDSLEAHLIGCDACRAFRVQMDAVVAGLDDLRGITNVADRHGAVRRRVPLLHHVAGMLRMAAVLAIVVAGGWAVRLTFMAAPNRPVAEGEGPGVAIPVYEVEVRLAADSRERLIAEMKPTDHPRVHLIWLHTALSKPGGGRPQSSNEEPSGGELGQFVHRNAESGSSRDRDSSV